MIRRNDIHECFDHWSWHRVRREQSSSLQTLNYLPAVNHDLEALLLLKCCEKQEYRSASSNETSIQMLGLKGGHSLYYGMDYDPHLRLARWNNSLGFSKISSRRYRAICLP